MRVRPTQAEGINARPFGTIFRPGCGLLWHNEIVFFERNLTHLDMVSLVPLGDVESELKDLEALLFGFGFEKWRFGGITLFSSDKTAFIKLVIKLAPSEWPMFALICGKFEILVPRYLQIDIHIAVHS